MVEFIYIFYLTSSIFHFGRHSTTDGKQQIQTCSVSIQKKFNTSLQKVQRCPLSQTLPRNLQTSICRRKRTRDLHESPGVAADPRRRRPGRRRRGGGGWRSPTRRSGTPAGGAGGPGPEQCLVQMSYAGPTMLECVTIIILSPVRYF